MPCTQKQASPCDNQPAQHLVCPLESCQRVFKTKPACMSHVNSQHSGIDPSQLDPKEHIFLPEQKNPCLAPANRSGITSLHSSPNLPPSMDVDAMQDILSDSIFFDMSWFEDHPPSRSSVESWHNGPDYHPTINDIIFLSPCSVLITHAHRYPM